ncbi:MAG TPA: hypothetical protein PLB32_14175 [Acidobacteriota bacterium]|nr:hypothetical protein [Acidobacteriota bacterium]
MKSQVIYQKLFSFTLVPVLLLLCALTINLGAPINIAAQSGKVFTTSKILEFEMKEGSPNWIFDAKERVQKAKWEFQPNGKFIFFPYHSACSKLEGKYKVTGNVYTFEGSCSNTVGVGTTNSYIVGNIDFTGEHPLLKLNWITTNGAAAVINNTSFASSNASHYEAKILLKISE